MQNKRVKSDVDSDKKHSVNRANKSRLYDKGRSRRRKYSSDEMDKDRDSRYHHRNKDGNLREEKDNTNDRYRHQKKSQHSKY